MNRPEQPFDVVHRPRHYNSHPSGVQPIEICRHLSGDWFNAFKYVFRAEYKNGKQDIEKALWYAKDGVAHSLPIHAPTWRFPQHQLLNLVLQHERGHRHDFFRAIKIGNAEKALRSVENVLETWPTDE